MPEPIMTLATGTEMKERNDGTTTRSGKRQEEGG